MAFGEPEVYETEDQIPNVSLTVSSGGQKQGSINDVEDGIDIAPNPSSESISKKLQSWQRNKILFNNEQEYFTDPNFNPSIVNKAFIMEKLKCLVFEAQEMEQLIDSLPDETPQALENEPSVSQLLHVVRQLQHDLSVLSGKVLPSTPESNLSENSITMEKIAKIKQQIHAFPYTSSCDDDDASSNFQSQSKPSSSDKVENLAHPITYELYYNSQASQSLRQSKIAQLESRLATLEKLIGTHHLHNTITEVSIENILKEEPFQKSKFLVQSCGSLLGALERLELQTSLLGHPEILEHTSKKMNSITHDIEKLMEVRKRYAFESSLMYGNDSSSRTLEMESHTIQSEYEKKIDHIYALIEKLSPVVDSIPHLITRLRALKQLHSEAAVFADSLKLLNEQQDMMQEQILSMNRDVLNLSKSIVGNQEIMMKNVEALQSSLKM